MPRKIEILNQFMSDARSALNVGNTAAAHDGFVMVASESLVIIADKLTEIEKRLQILVTPIDEALKEVSPVNLEKAAKLSTLSKPSTPEYSQASAKES